jgi:protein involved in polysaccharide export with SLBB domain
MQTLVETAKIYGKFLSSTALLAAFLCATEAPVLASLHPGDKIDVTVLNHPELSGPATIDASGDVSLPVAGTVRAASYEPTELADRIRDRLVAYVRKPAVIVQLQEQSQSVFVSGGPSGVLHYEPGETLTSVVDQLELTPVQRTESAMNPHDELGTGTSGSQQRVTNGPLDLFNGPIDFTRVSILRDAKELGPFDVLALRSSGEPGPALLPDDTIQLANKPIAVKVTGDVPEPGMAYLDPTEPLSHALDQVGGTDATSTQTAISLERDGTSRVVSLGSVTFAEPARNGDVLFVPRAPRVDVLGTVVKPGETFLRGNQSLVAAIYYAGGPDRFANLKSVQVVHDGKKSEYNLRSIQKGHGGANPTLSDGDVVFVPQGSTIDAQTIFTALTALTGVGYLIYR